MNLTQLETLLDTSRLQVWCGTAWYDVRRNGKTRLWKRQPKRFAIPCKVGFRCAFTLTDADINHATVREKPAFRPDLTNKQNLARQRFNTIEVAGPTTSPADYVGYLMPKEDA